MRPRPRKRKYRQTKNSRCPRCQKLIPRHRARCRNCNLANAG